MSFAMMCHHQRRHPRRAAADHLPDLPDADVAGGGARPVPGLRDPRRHACGAAGSAHDEAFEICASGACRRRPPRSESRERLRQRRHPGPGRRCASASSASTTRAGARRRARAYVNLDNAASTPALREVLDTVNHFMSWYSSVHRGTGFKSRVATQAYDEARADRGAASSAPTPHEHAGDLRQEHHRGHQQAVVPAAADARRRGARVS